MPIFSQGKFHLDYKQRVPLSSPAPHSKWRGVGPQLWRWEGVVEAAGPGRRSGKPGLSGS